MRKIFVIAVVAILLVATCTAIEQPQCYKNVKVPAWYLDLVKNQSNTIHAVQWQNTGFVMPNLAGLKGLQARHG